MPTTLDNILNVVVPLGIFAFFGFKIYMGAESEINRLARWIKGMFADDEEMEYDPYAPMEITFQQ